MRKQQGFTLIELAIVLVIIGLLLGGVLKGQELINSAKVKSLASDFKNVQVFMYGYQDRFRALPGDDPVAATHIAGSTQATTPGRTGNSLIDGAWNTTTNTDESCVFWEHVRRAGVASGPTTVNCADPNDPSIPRNAESGRLGIQSLAGAGGFATITDIAGDPGGILTGAFVVCSDGILGRLARQIDTTLDDGDPQRGSVRMVVQGTTGKSIATAALIDAQAYTVCMTF